MWNNLGKKWKLKYIENVKPKIWTCHDTKHPKMDTRICQNHWYPQLNRYALAYINRGDYEQREALEELIGTLFEPLDTEVLHTQLDGKKKTKKKYFGNKITNMHILSLAEKSIIKLTSNTRWNNAYQISRKCVLGVTWPYYLCVQSREKLLNPPAPLVLLTNIAIP